MPTAARLTAAICFAIVGYIFAITASPYFPEAKEPSYWVMLNVAAGVILGWVVCGSRAGRGYLAGIANGLTTGIGMMFWVYFLISFHQMIRKSLRKSYDGPIESIIDVFALMMETGMPFVVRDVIVVIVGGVAIAGLITEFIGKRWP